MTATPPGWYPDPSGRAELRWWDGSQWSDHASRGGVVEVVPPGSPASVRSPITGPRLRVDRRGRAPMPAAGWRLFDDTNLPLGEIVAATSGGSALRDMTGRVVARIVPGPRGPTIEAGTGRLGTVGSLTSGEVVLEGSFGTIATLSLPSAGGWTIADGDGIPVATMRPSPRPDGITYDLAWAADLDEAIRVFCAFTPLLVEGSIP